MPTSDKQGKFIAKALIGYADPFEIWDIGPGNGTYFDLMKNTQVQSNTYWVAVEVWKEYIDQFGLAEKYDQVFHEDVRETYFPPAAVTQDFCPSLVIFGDVLEHMPENDARKLILEAKRSFRWILVSIPIVHAPQGAVNGNPYEEHVKHWSFDEMHAAMGHCMAFKGHTIGLYWWDSQEDV